MSASEATYTVNYTISHEYAPARLHLVSDTEVSSRSRRKAHARAVARIRDRAQVRTYAALGSVAAVFTTGFATIVWAFIAIPGAPVP